MSRTRVDIVLQHDYLCGPLDNQSWGWIDTAHKPFLTLVGARLVMDGLRAAQAARPSRFVRDWRIVARTVTTSDEVLP